MSPTRPEKIVVNVDGLTDGSKVLRQGRRAAGRRRLFDVEDPEESVVTVEVPEDAAAPVEVAAGCCRRCRSGC